MSERNGSGTNASRPPGLPPKKTRRRRRRRDVSDAPDNSSSQTGRSYHHVNNRTAKRNKARAKRRSKQQCVKQRASKLRIIQQNVAGLKKRETELLNRLVKMDADIAVLQECNFSISEDRNGKITHTIPEYRGWNVVATPRLVGRASGSNSAGRGGVAILIKDTINYEVLTSKPVPDDDLTTEYCGARIYPNDNRAEQIDIHNIYIPPINESAEGEDRVQRWNTNKLPTSSSTFIFSDTNCHGSWDSRLSNNAMSDNWDDWMTTHSFTAMNHVGSPDSYTRTSSRGKKSSPDITVIPSQWVGRTSWSPLTKSPGGSDHLPILIDVKLPSHRDKEQPKRTNKKRNQRAKWAFKKANWEKFRELQDEVFNSWPQQAEAWSAHKRNNAITYAIMRAAEASIPRGLRIDPKPFWNAELEAKAKECNMARERAHVSTEEAEQFKQRRKEYDIACTKEKKKAWHDFVEGIDSKTNPSKVWNVIGGLDGRKSKSKPGVELREEKDSARVAITDNQKAKLFIDTYINASKSEETLKGREKKLAEKDVVHGMRNATKGCKSCGGEKTGMCAPINMSEMKSALYKVKTGKAAGPDRITNEMLKHLSVRGYAELLRLFNQSWLEGCAPGPWKLGEIIPLPKPGKDHQLTGSYRPINLLSVIGKLLERIVKARLESFLESNNKLDPNQAGFRKGRSTVEQIGRLTQSIHDGFEDGLRTLVVYVDFSRAYDKVWRDKLFAKMGEMDIPGCYTKWVQSSLSDRNSYVNWYGSKSKKRRFDNGVPQGSVISPLLWLIYINDLVSMMPAETQLGTGKSLFADDVALLCRGRTVEECEEMMQKSLDCLEKWAADNKMEISIRDDKDSKTVSCFYTLNFKEESKGKVIPNLMLKGIKIFHTTTPKFLGVIVDQSLSFKAHTEEKAKKMGKRNNVLRALAGRSWGQKGDDLRNVHVTYNQPVADYAIGAWGSFVAKSNMDNLEIKQNEAARIITGCCRDTVTEFLLAEAELMPIRLRAEQEAVLLYERNMRLPSDVPAKQLAEADVKKRHLKKKAADGLKIKPPREKAVSILKEMQLLDVQRDQVATYASVEPWNWNWDPSNIRFSTELAGCSGRKDSTESIHAALNTILDSIPDGDMVVYTDGSVGADNKNGGAGGFIKWPHVGVAEEFTVPCGSRCTSYRAELAALREVFRRIHDDDETLRSEYNIWLFTDSESSLERLQRGPGAQIDALTGEIWKLLSSIGKHHKIVLQWIPGHKNIAGNEAADELAKSAAQMSQEDTMLDFLTVKAAVKLHIRRKWRAAVHAKEGIYSEAKVRKPPTLPNDATRKQETTIRQLRTGASPLVRGNWANYALRPEEEKLCPNGCGRKEDVKHLFWTCPDYAAQRLKHFGTTTPDDNILFGNIYNILNYLEDIGHSTAPTVEEDSTVDGS